MPLTRNLFDVVDLNNLHGKSQLPFVPKSLQVSTFSIVDTMNDGWDDDEDLGLDQLDSTEEDKASGSGSGWKGTEELINEGGWEDDTDLNLDEDWGETPKENPDNEYSDRKSTYESTSEGGWEEDEELFGDDDEGEEMPLPTRSQNLLQELQDYVESLDRILSSINAVLEYEYNTPEKSHELFDYYSTRPGLAEYTRTKELPRMNYQVVLPNGRVETSKEQIAQHHLPDHSLMARCANQSLLADLLHVLTGPDLVVRPQFLAICVAQTCQFRLHIGDAGRDMLQCNCMLQLSLPVAEGPRLNIATIRTTVVFSPNQPMVKFKVDKIIVLLKDYSKLRPVAEFLNMMEGHFQELPGHEDLELQSAPADIFRDAFLEQSHHLMNQSKAGFQSALQEMESVMGLQSKLKAVRGGISKFLPDTNVLLAAEEEARALATERERYVPPPRNPVGIAKFLPDTNDILAAEEETLAWAAERERQIPTSTRPVPPLGGLTSNKVRPQSILGGLVKTGWSALANSVLIPDEDPAIYGQVPSQPMLYHQKEESNLFQSQLSTQPSLYRREEPVSQPVQQHQFAAPSMPKETIPIKPVVVSCPRPSSPPRTTSPTSPLAARNAFGHNDDDEEEAKPSMDLDPPSVEDEYAYGWGDDDDLADITSDVMDDDVNNDTSDSDSTASSTLAGKEELIQLAVINPIDIVENVVSAPDCPPLIIPTPMQDISRDELELQSPIAGSSIHEKPRVPSRRALIADIDYNPEDDIMPTRQRWVHPRPDRSYLFQ